MSDTVFSVPFSVRDYECDQQGIVNNSVYANYLEHTRHMFLRDHGFRFAALHEQGVDLVLSELNLKFHRSLKADDVFQVTAAPKLKSPARMVFEQSILREDGTQMVSALATVVCISNGRPSRFPDELVEALVKTAS